MHLGVVLQQCASLRGLQPLGFFTQKLDKTQQKYSAFNRELLVAYLCIRHFRWSLEGWPFVLLADHKPLTFALHQQSNA